jgi:hypothetical protein
MERVSVFCAVTSILTLFSCKSPSGEAAVMKISSPSGKDADPRIPILKQAKAEYAKLK